MNNELNSLLILKLSELTEVLKPPAIYLNWSFWNTTIVFFTLIILVWYTIETRRIATQSKEANLRPVILRSGYISSWNSIKFKKIKGVISGNKIQFKILKNIVTGISGYIILDGFRYELLFGNQVTQLGDNITHLKEWGWQGPNTYIFAIFDSEKGAKSQKQNSIVLNYQDVEGNYFHTVENSNWEQQSSSGKV